MHLGGDEIDSHSGLLSATFCDGAVQAAFLADQGSDANFITQLILPLIVGSNPRDAVRHLPAPRSY